MPNFFPRWTNLLPLQIGLVLIMTGSAVTAGLWYYFTPKYTRVGYQPSQPVPFSHKIHVDQHGMDCRYCHSFVEKSSHSNLPSTATCMSCHRQIAADSPLLEPVRSSFKTTTPLQWTRVHDLPDFTYFDHSVHIKRGVGCASCHGRVDQMPLMRRHADLSMGWCLDCHRDPTPHLRPMGEVFNMAWEPPEDQTLTGKRLADARHIQVLEGCSYCHR